MQVHNGPFVETREQLGGYYLIRAENLQAAQRWAAQCPAAIWGHIEIREVSEPVGRILAIRFVVGPPGGRLRPYRRTGPGVLHLLYCRMSTICLHASWHRARCVRKKRRGARAY